MLKKFPHLFLVLLIEGGALMAVELMGAKLVAPFYGNSLYVWTAVLTITVLGLTLGYYAGGRLAKNRPSETKLFVVLGISAVLVLALPLTASIAITLTKGMDLIVGICVTCVLLLLPPMFCFGIVGPMVVSLMSSQLETVGKTAGTVYFTSTFGGIAATFFFGLYFIPVAGLRLCATVTGLALAALPAVYVAKRALGGRTTPRRFTETPYKNRYCRAFVSDARVGSNRKKSRAKSKPGSSAFVRLRRSKPILAVRPTIYLFAVLEGATVMAVELMSARMVAPYFGSSLYVWATVIGFTLLALAIGYFLGGIVADKYSGPNTLLWVLLIASLFLLVMHISAEWLTIAFENVSPGIAVILVSMTLILPPLVFLGMVPTFLIRKVSATADHAGTSTGRVYAISSASGIVALPLFGFFIIPRFGLTLPSIITGLVVGLVPFVKLISQKTFRGAASNAGRSSATPGPARLRGATARQAGARSFNVKKYAAFSFVAVALFSFWAIKTQRPGKSVDVKCYSEGLLGQVLVADVSDAAQKSHDRMLMVNRIVQMWMDMKTGKPKWDYIFYDYSVCSKLPEKSDALILGLGGGFLASVFQERFEFNVDGVELDERIAEVARDYFGLSDKVNVVVDDARHYLEKANKKYDLILFDVYRGELPPPHVFTLESLAKARELLKQNGLILVNFNGYLEGNIGKPARSIYKTLVAAGLEARILPTPGPEAHRNLLFVASKKKQDFHAVRSPLFQHGKPVDIETLFLDPREPHLNDAVVLTDDKPILELLNIAAGNAWRKGYTEMTKRFYKEGVPLFR